MKKKKWHLEVYDKTKSQKHPLFFPFARSIYYWHRNQQRVSTTASLHNLLNFSLSLAMLPRIRSFFKMDQKVEESKNKLGFVLASNKSTVAVGLGIVIQVPGKSNIVISPALRLKPLKHHPKHLSTFSAQSSFLSSCYLCNRLLSPNNDVYMYR